MSKAAIQSSAGTQSVKPHPAEPYQTAEPPLLPADSEGSQLTLLLTQYLTQPDIELVWAAYRYAAFAHAGQTRQSGEP